ncbi:family 16 glycosylhydrolase [Kribbella shirazensis]|uniref:licheninase n=1 Tax=Kribbella shirazensis TaxID=1105143 RepID=A0A7X5VJL2_9ACTN|nr:family 16 glycosylhydrolase [Kribbella shirazensis]NIK61597.1 beta-glucanase (GH16 family) [Kribbella shirazensis]
MRLTALLAAPLLLAAAAPSPAGSAEATAAVAAAPAAYQLAWADEFVGDAPNTAEWSYRTDTKGSQQRPENVAVGGGLMTISLCPKNRAGANCGTTVDSGGLYTGGGLISKRRLRYGYYETRAKTNVGKGWHSAFWAAQLGGTSPQTEIDGFEVDSVAPAKIRHNVIGWDQGGLRTSGIYDTFDTSAAFHTYGFEWREDSVRFYVDGVLVERQGVPVTYPADSYLHNFLNVWLTAIAYPPAAPDVDESALPGKVQFDYFRFYQRDAYADNDTPAGTYTESGTGWTTSSVRGFAGLTARFSCDSGTAGRWTITPPATGSYDVYFYRVGGSGGQVDAPVTVWDGSTALIRSRVDLTQASGWVRLGNQALTGGTSYIVRIDRDGAGCIRADSVKLVRSN